MENFDKNAYYRFRLGGEVVKGWSKENFCELELDPAKADQLYCEMLPGQYDKEMKKIIQLSLPFMKQNSSKVNAP